MKTALRALSVAITALWLFIATTTVSAIYSATMISIEGVDVKGYAEEDTVGIMVNITLYNGGFYAITDLVVGSEVFLLLKPTRISASRTEVPSVGPGERSTVSHRMDLSLSELASDEEVIRILVMNDTFLNLTLTISCTYAAIFLARLDTNITWLWGAPMSGLRVGSISWGAGVISVPLSFRNNSPLNYTFWLELLDGSGSPLGSSDRFVIPPGTVFSQDIDITVGGPIPPAEGRLICHMLMGTTEISLEVARIGS